MPMPILRTAKARRRLRNSAVVFFKHKRSSLAGAAQRADTSVAADESLEVILQPRIDRAACGRKTDCIFVLAIEEMRRSNSNWCRVIS
jgi:hypothetical protein